MRKLLSIWFIGAVLASILVGSYREAKTGQRITPQAAARIFIFSAAGGWPAAVMAVAGDFMGSLAARKEVGHAAR